MNQEIFEKIKTIFYENKGYATTRELSAIGINRFYISELRKNEKIEQVKSGFYKWSDYDFELVEVFKIIHSSTL